MNKNLKKLVSSMIVVGLSLGVAACAKKTDGGEKFPTKAINIIVPYSAGGGTDITTRALADSAKGHISQPLVVVNKTGAGGAVGMGEGANSKADGYNVTTITVELTTLPPQGLAQFTSEDFIPLLQFNAEPAAITVKADAPWNTIEEFIADAQAKPGEIKIGNSGIGAIWHLAALAFEKEIDTTFNHIPYEGANPAVTALLGGHIEAVTVSPPEVAAQVKAGELKILAVMAPERAKKFADVPTLKEKGYDVNVKTWRGFGVPKDTPAEVVAVLEEAFTKGSKEKAFIDFMELQGLSVAILDKDQFKASINADNKLFKDLIESIK
jgi:tripartite-type tricarboxylate transporter receptor subunit TctC